MINIWIYTQRKSLNISDQTLIVKVTMLSRCQPRVHSLTALVVKVDRRAACSGHPMDSSFLEEGSPTMVEKGMDPSTVFEMCDDDDDNGIHDIKESGVGGGTGAAEAANAANSAAAASLPSGSEGNASLRHRRAGRSVDRAEVKAKRESWMDPPGETESNTLTQAEMESCMQTYTVRASLLLSNLNRIDHVLTLVFSVSSSEHSEENQKLTFWKL